MNLKYQILFRTLDYCYQKGCRDDLPPLLGEMSTDIFADHLPADLMVYQDWQNICPHLESNEVIRACIVQLLEQYEDLYDWDFCDTKLAVTSLSDAEFDMIRVQVKNEIEIARNA